MEDDGGVSYIKNKNQESEELILISSSKTVGKSFNLCGFDSLSSRFLNLESPIQSKTIVWIIGPSNSGCANGYILCHWFYV